MISDADRTAVAAVDVGAFVAAPLIRDGRLIAALCVADLSPRAWTPEEVELVRETAERTWEAIERARAEVQLLEADARKDEFLAMLAHELRNPLAPIRTGLELIRRGGDTVGAVERVRGMMERQVGHMIRLIDDLLDVSRITSGKIALQRESTSLGSLIHSAVEAERAALAAKHIEVSVDLPEDQCVIDVDPTRFAQVLSNLLHNAAKFTNNGGSVRISATITPPTSGAIPQVSISVVDSGIGISPELLPRVFDLFTQGETGSPQPGLGIGLALARRLVELHAGRLEARSEGHGRGSEFLIQLPLATAQSVSAKEHADEQRLERRILVIDDNQDAANATALLIEDMGGESRVAYDGESALAMLQGYQPEVILLDIGMRGLDGYETCQRIRRVLGNRVVLVALTGFGQEQDKEKTTRAGFDAHLTKPADGAALAAILASRASSSRVGIIQTSPRDRPRGGCRSLLTRAGRDAFQRFRPHPHPTPACCPPLLRVNVGPGLDIGRSEPSVQFRGTPRSVFRLFRQAAQNELLQILRHWRRPFLRRWNGGGLQVLSEHLHHRVAFEDLPASEEVVGDAPERIQIRAPVHPGAQRHLGGHVTGRSSTRPA